MLAELHEVARSLASPGTTRAEEVGKGVGLELLLVSRREHAVYNSVGHHLPALRRRRPYNPAYVHPTDAQRLGASAGSTVIIESTVGAIRAVLVPAPDVRPGVVSMAHGFEPDADGHGACTAALVDDERDCESLSGLPRMSAIPVRVSLAG